MAETGELWSLNRNNTGERRRLPFSKDIMSFAASSERNRVVFVAQDQEHAGGSVGCSARWAWRTPELADDVGRAFTVLDREIIGQALTARSQLPLPLVSMDRDRANYSGFQVVNIRSVSPDGRWLAVEDNVTRRTVLYRLGNDRMPPIPLCAGCFVSWVARGRYLQVRFGGLSDAEHRRMYLVPIPTGEMLPARFREGRVASEEEVAKLPDVERLPKEISVSCQISPTSTCTRNCSTSEPLPDSVAMRAAAGESLLHPPALLSANQWTSRDRPSAAAG